MPVTSRPELITHCLRRLGHPVIEVNVSTEQMEDCVDDTIQLYQEFHSDATYRTFLKHQITAADVTNKYVSISSDVLYVTRMLPLAEGSLGASSGMFSVRYQIALNDMATMQNFIGNIQYYEQLGQYLSTLDMVLNGSPIINFQRKQNRLYIHGEWWDNELSEGDWIVIEAYQIVDPTTHTSIYNDMFVKNYTTSLIKQRWGQNMSKFEGMQLPGGVTISGREMLLEANQELKDLEEKMRLEYEPMPDFFIG
jgi:hypothetical protein